MIDLILLSICVIGGLAGAGFAVSANVVRSLEVKAAIERAEAANTPAGKTTDTAEATAEESNEASAPTSRSSSTPPRQIPTFLKFKADDDAWPNHPPAADDEYWDQPSGLRRRPSDQPRFAAGIELRKRLERAERMEQADRYYAQASKHSDAAGHEHHAATSQSALMRFLVPVATRMIATLVRFTRANGG